MIITGTDGSDAGLKALLGTDGDDLISGLAGKDELFGERGNDILVGGAGNDRIDGGDGLDLASYGGSSAAVDIDLNMGRAIAGAFTDHLLGVENIVGSAFGDVIFGSDAANDLYGGDGDDYLRGGDGADRLFGGAGNDAIDYVGSGSGVTVNLATGLAFGGTAQGDSFVGIERVVGSSFADTLTGDDGVNSLRGHGGDDTLRGGGGRDYLVGEQGKDTLWGEGGNDSFVFEPGGSSGLKAQADTIKDFSEAEGDRIDLSGLDGTLEFIGDAQFSHGHELRVTTSGGNTYVAINLTGADTAEMVIRLDGLHTLEQNDFLL